MKDWRHLEARQKYVAAVIEKLKAEGRTHFTLADVESILKDAFKVEASDDFNANYYLMTANHDYQIDGPRPFLDAYENASKMADAHQCDVTILQEFDTCFFIDY